MRHPELLAQAAQRRRPIHRIQVLALEVLDERELSGLAVIDLLDDGWDLGPAQALHRAPAALAGDQFMPRSPAANHDGLHQAGLGNAAGQGVEHGWVHLATRLVCARRDAQHGDEGHADAR
jgi:hypothetical protein